MSTQYEGSDLAHLLDLSPADFFPRLTTTLDDMGLEDAERQSQVGRLAWHARSRGADFRTPERRDQVDALWYHGQRLRYDFRFRELRDRTQEWQDFGVRDPLVDALAAFAQAGLGEARAVEDVQAVLRRKRTGSINAVCLHALWFAPGPEAAEACLSLANELIESGGADANVYFRKASSLRKLGEFDQARRSIDYAIGDLSPGQNAIHQDYVRERELIESAQVLSRSTNAAVEKLTGFETRTEERLKQAEAMVSDSLMRSMEILGLFLALAGFIFGTVGSIASSSSLRTQLLAMSFLLVGTFCFLLMMRWVTRHPNTPKKSAAHDGPTKDRTPATSPRA